MLQDVIKMQIELKGVGRNAILWRFKEQSHMVISREMFAHYIVNKPLESCFLILALLSGC